MYATATATTTNKISASPVNAIPRVAASATATAPTPASSWFDRQPARRQAAEVCRAATPAIIPKSTATATMPAQAHTSASSEPGHPQADTGAVEVVAADDSLHPHERGVLAVGSSPLTRIVGFRQRRVGRFGRDLPDRGLTRVAGRTCVGLPLGSGFPGSGLLVPATERPPQAPPDTGGSTATSSLSVTSTSVSAGSPLRHTRHCSSTDAKAGP